MRAQQQSWLSSPLKVFGIGDKRVKSNFVTISRYFQYWNARDMNGAIELFDDDCVYEDTLYPTVFRGREQLKAHLYNVATALPESFKFVIDSFSEDTSTGNVGIQWHVESDGTSLPFTRGCSMYTVDSNGLITKGFDVPEPVVKSGSISLQLLKSVKPFIVDRNRIIPAVAWVFYCWFLFLSDIAPGLPATSIDPNTWDEVLRLSLNFWLVLPLLSPDNAAVVHPILEGTFNLVLCWAGLFAGFLSDGKSAKGGNRMLGTVAGMQFLTNAVLLPYLVSRDTNTDATSTSSILETGKPVAGHNSDDRIIAFSESKLLPIVFGAVGVLSILWCAVGRTDTFGDLPTRIDSYTQLVGSDRLSFSFLVDLLYFAVFQGWLIDDDVRRRLVATDVPVTVPPSLADAAELAKRVPFFGVLYYFFIRPPLQQSKN